MHRHRLVVPEVPDAAEYLPLLEEMQSNGWYSNFGPLARRLEEQLLAALGAPQETCVTCCNATAGLSAALLATGRAGQVLLPAFTFAASLGAIRAAGMTPLVADVDPMSWTLSPDSIERALTGTDVRIVMLVAPFGIARNWEQELTICRRHDAAVIIDNASGLGGPRNPIGLGPEGFEVFSMHATKPYAVGEGGVIFADSIHESALRSVLNFALTAPDKSDGPRWGFNGKMSELHAAIGLAQLKRFRERIGERQAFVAVYQDRLAHRPEVTFPGQVNLAPWQFFPILLPSAAAAERFIARAAVNGIEIRRYYRPSLSRWPQTPCVEGCPVAEDLADRMCLLPVRSMSAGAEAHEIIDSTLNSLDQALAVH